MASEIPDGTNHDEMHLTGRDSSTQGNNVHTVELLLLLLL